MVDGTFDRGSDFINFIQGFRFTNGARIGTKIFFGITINPASRAGRDTFTLAGVFTM